MWKPLGGWETKKPENLVRFPGRSEEMQDVYQQTAFAIMPGVYTPQCE